MHVGGLEQGVPRAPLDRQALAQHRAATSATGSTMHALESNLMEARQAAQKLTFSVCRSVLPPLAAAQCLLLVTSLQCTFQELLAAVLGSAA